MTTETTYTLEYRRPEPKDEPQARWRIVVFAAGLARIRQLLAQTIEANRDRQHLEFQIVRIEKITTDTITTSEEAAAITFR